jgi:prepilin-type processing-associated H-X9-DG protein
LANTLAVVEVTNVEIPWTAPIDLDARTMSLRINDANGNGISAMHWGQANISFLDGSYLRLEQAISPQDLKALTTISGGEPPRIK